MTSVHIPAGLRAELREHLRATAPREACGVLIGTSVGDSVDVARVVRCGNLAAGDDRFELDPLDLVRADAAARADGLSVVGIWHSHPDGSPHPSAADRRAAWPGWAQVVVTERTICFA